MRFEQEFIETVKNSNNIVDVIKEYTPLKRSGRNYTCCCPFHNEKTPSFFVSEDKQIYKCFGCGVGGNVFTFISQIENVGFVESVEKLANRVNIPIPKYTSSYDPKKDEELKKMYSLYEDAMLFYHQRLYDSNVSKIAQEYVKKRKLNNTTLKDFKIGYSGEFNELYNFLIQKGYDEKTILESQLVNKADNGKFYDRYRNRLMFPICNAKGQVIAFGGRVLDDSKPKYINSPDTLIYNKSKHLYGYNLARKHIKDKVLIVEGYMDVISCHQRGVKNVVASLGTALSDKQLYLINKNQIVLSFDKDMAGQNAIDRSIEIAKKMGIKPLVLQLDEKAKDPDEYMLKFGNYRFINCIENAIPVIEFRIKRAKENYDLTKTKDKVDFLNEVTKIIASSNDPIERETYIAKVSKTYDISKEVLNMQVNNLEYKPEQINISRPNNLDTLALRSTLKKSREIEYTVINLLINTNYEVYQTIKNYAQVIDDVGDEVLSNIIKKIYDQYETYKVLDINLLMTELSQEENAIIADILIKDIKSCDIEKTIDNIILYYSKQQLNNKKEFLLEKYNIEENPEKKLEYLKQLNEIMKKQDHKIKI